MEICVLASGPSMCREDAERVAAWRNGVDRLALAVNNTFLLLPVVDLIFATDRRWWRKFHSQAAETGAELWCQTPQLALDFGLNATAWTSDSGNSGERALRFAAQDYSAKRIILLGFDMQHSSRMHWHGLHPEGWPNPEPKNFRTWREWIKRLVNETPQIEWINASRETALDCMPRKSLEDALQ